MSERGTPTEKNGKRRFAFVLVAAVVAVCAAGMYLRFHLGFSDPPRIGERANAVIQRLGPPAFDSRERADQDDFQIGYTDRLGTRYKLYVTDGTVTDIEYSSR